MFDHHQDRDPCRRHKPARLTGKAFLCSTLGAASLAAAEMPVILHQHTLQPAPSAQIESEAIDGNTIVLGAPTDGSLADEAGAVHVFERPPGGAWVQTAWLQSISGGECQLFGRQVDIEGSTLIANHWRVHYCGSPELSWQVGMHAFERVGGNWAQTLDLNNLGGRGLYFAFDGTSIVNGRAGGGVVALTRNEDGTWPATWENLPSVWDGATDGESPGERVDIHDGFAAFGGSYSFVPSNRDRTLPTAALYERDLQGEWQRLEDVKVAPAPGRAGVVSVTPPAPRIAVGPRRVLAINDVIYELDASGQHVETTSLRPSCTADAPVTVRFDAQRDLALVHTGHSFPNRNPDFYSLWRRSGKLHLYSRAGFGQWQPVAQLIPQDNSPVGLSAIDAGIAVDDTRVWDTDAASTSYQFSDADPCLGHRGNWIELTPQRWGITNGAYTINTSDYASQSGDRPGEYALVGQYRYDNMLLTLKARSDETLSPYSAADYVVIFGYQDDSNYYYMMFSRYRDNNELFKVVNGVRQRIARAPRDSFTDNEFHEVEIRHLDSQIRIRFDGQDYLTVSDSTFPSGAVGVGSYNDAASFDDIQVQALVDISALQVNEAAPGSALWSVRTDLPGEPWMSSPYADRTYETESVPAILHGATWIQTAATSKAFTGHLLATFQVREESDVYIALDERTVALPAWLEDWTATGLTMRSWGTPPIGYIVYNLYRKRFPAGATVTLGHNGSTSQPTYIPIIRRLQ